MRIPAWMIKYEMKLTEHYKMYAEVFGLDVPLTQSQPTESTQGTHRTPSAPRSPNPATETTESMPSAKKADEMILQDMIQVSLAEHKSREKQKARENVALVYEHLAAEEIEKLVEDPENVDDSSPPRHDDTSIPGTRRRVKGKNVAKTRISLIPSPTRSPRNLSTLVSSDIEKLQELTVTHPTPSSGSSEPKLTKTNRLLSLIKAKPNRFKRYKSFFHELQGRYGYLFAHLKKRFMPRTSSDQLADNLYDVMMETLPSLVKEKVTEQVKKEVPAQVPCRSSAVRTRDQDDPHDDAHPEGENSAKRQKTSEYEAYVSGESSSGQVNVEEPGPSTSGNQEQDDEFDFWTDSYASDDDEIPTKQVTQEIMEEISLTIDEAKLKKMADEMLRQRSTKDHTISSKLSSVIWERVHDFQLGIESYQQKINLTAPTITFLGIEEYDVFSIVYEPVHGIIYTNSKKEKRVKYGYVQKELTNDEVEFLKLFEEEIEVRLNYRDQMRRWEMYVNGRPLGPRRERPE
ncbi:hypothetical protein Tco_1280889 [Tanacetum coccineum]